jgi:hypothetical protein
LSAVLITYDLHQPGQRYEKLAEAIKALGPWWHYLESTWIVATTLTPDQIWDRISGPLDGNDSVLILNITGDASQGWLSKDAWNWINQHV